MHHVGEERIPIPVTKQTFAREYFDILPGSSIREVYDVTDKEYGEIFERDEVVDTKFIDVWEKQA